MTRVDRYTIFLYCNNIYDERNYPLVAGPGSCCAVVQIIQGKISETGENRRNVDMKRKS